MQETDYGNLYMNGELEIDIKSKMTIIDLSLKENETIRDGVV